MPMLSPVLESNRMGVSGMGGLRALVVEDSEDQAALLARHLSRAGCEVTVVGTAEDAILAYAVDEPDVAVVDLQLPGMDGWQLIARLRDDLPRCVVVVTSVLDPSDFPEADAVLPKPFSSAQVRRVLADAVPGRADR
jgi:CheY-like chemotaxis protein